jgi:predicted Fe-S protein YdhL (DUF1289 family)
MIGATLPMYSAANRFGHVAAAGATVRRPPRPPGTGTVTEFATPSGEVVARKVEALGRTECWLRSDIAAAAANSLAEEAAECARVVEEVVAWMNLRDAARAAEHGLSVEQYRSQRNHTLARIDARRGKNSVGLG